MPVTAGNSHARSPSHRPAEKSTDLLCAPPFLAGTDLRPPVRSQDELADGRASSAKSILVAANTISPCGSLGCPGMAFGRFARAHSAPESVSAGVAELILAQNRTAQTVRSF